MRIQYLFHSGFWVETAACHYLFDYYRGALPAFDAEKPVVVLASHAHRDHYQQEVFAALQQAGAADVHAVLSSVIPKKQLPPLADVLRVRAGETYDLPGGARLETLLSTDSGVAFLLTTGEGVVFHAGDLNDWSWEGESEADNRQMRGSYRHEIDKLRGRPIDAAFLPLDPRQRSHYADGVLYFLSVADAKAVFPMHYWKRPEIIDQFLAEHPEYRAIIQHTEQAAGGITL